MISIVKHQISGGRGADMATFIEIMKVLTYLKIICTQKGH